MISRWWLWQSLSILEHGEGEQNEAIAYSSKWIQLIQFLAKKQFTIWILFNMDKNIFQTFRAFYLLHLIWLVSKVIFVCMFINWAKKGPFVDGGFIKIVSLLLMWWHISMWKYKRTLRKMKPHVCWYYQPMTTLPRHEAL